MGAPNIIFTSSGNKISNKYGFDFISVRFQASNPYLKFECRATKIGEEYGVGKGELIASFSSTPANAERAFEIYDDYLLKGDGEYRISLFVQGEDGSWNDNHLYIPVGNTSYITSDGKEYLCMRG